MLHVFGTQQQAVVRLTGEVARCRCGHFSCDEQIRGTPGVEAAIEQKHVVALAQPGQQPPGTGGEGGGAVIVKHHGAVVAHSPCAQALD
ncbi:hypothetical protein D3C77_489310 [compost metagenome]